MDLPYNVIINEMMGALQHKTVEDIIEIVPEAFTRSFHAVKPIALERLQDASLRLAKYNMTPLSLNRDVTFHYCNQRYKITASLYPNKNIIIELRPHPRQQRE